jgi:NADP-dependent aldehyde dehydrogenase
MTETSTISGKNFLGAAQSALGTSTFQAIGPTTGEPFGNQFFNSTIEEIDQAVTLASEAFGPFGHSFGESRATFLEEIANQIEKNSTAVIEQANLETALPPARLEGEMKRTTGQLRMFADFVRDESWVDAKIETAIPDRTPIPKPDLRRMLIPIGPIAVFGSSNFPLAYSVAGGDTASAIAAGCPVIVKAHPAHPGTSELVARCILSAAKATNQPEGVFSMVHGGPEQGIALVKHPDLRGVGFTGSLQGGRALFDSANSRPVPIPVFAEMGSVNPVFLMPSAFDGDLSALAKGYATSLTLGVGQFCTNPGIVIALESAELEEWIALVKGSIEGQSGTMLTPGIGAAYCRGVEHLSSHSSVTSVLPATTAGSAGLFKCSAETFLADDSLQSEAFGPCGLVVVCKSLEELLQVARSLHGQLTATVHSQPFEIPEDLIRILEQKAGRLVFNGWPTGVEVCSAMTHGGPYPASTDSRFSAVGTTSIRRWVRPISYQNWPSELLPPEIR